MTKFKFHQKDKRTILPVTEGLGWLWPRRRNFKLCKIKGLLILFTNNILKITNKTLMHILFIL